MTDLEQARLTINEVDQKMAELFCKRMEAVELVARYKSAHQMPIFDAAREEVVVKKNCAYIEQMRYLPYYEKFIRYEMGLSKDYQSTLIHSTVVGYFGAEGSHTHAAEQMLFPCEKSISFSTFEEIFDAVESGRIAYGVIPFENSNTGDVGNILDLLKTHNVYIRKMYDLKIRQCLLGLEGAPVSGVKTVFSHPQALSQCRDFLTQLSAEQVSSASTSEAAKHVAGIPRARRSVLPSLQSFTVFLCSHATSIPPRTIRPDLLSSLNRWLKTAIDLAFCLLYITRWVSSPA